MIWQEIIPGLDPPKHIFALIEIPKGSRNKYEISKTTNVIVLDRVLHSSVVFPHDYGLIPGTYAQDGDPLDILVLITSPTYPMTLISCQPIGVLLMEDEKGMDEKILAVSEGDPIYSQYQDIVQIPPHHLDEIEEFYRTYKHLENKKYANVKEWRGRDFAYQVIEESIERFKDKFGNISKINPLG